MTPPRPVVISVYDALGEISDAASHLAQTLFLAVGAAREHPTEHAAVRHGDDLLSGVFSRAYCLEKCAQSRVHSALDSPPPGTATLRSRDFHILNAAGDRRRERSPLESLQVSQVTLSQVRVFDERQVQGICDRPRGDAGAAEVAAEHRDGVSVLSGSSGRRARDLFESGFVEFGGSSWPCIKWRALNSDCACLKKTTLVDGMPGCEVMSLSDSITVGFHFSTRFVIVVRAKSRCKSMDM